jgi:hypothetical protein
MNPAARLLSARSSIPTERVLSMVTTLFGGDLHVKRVLSLANATMGAIVAGSLGVAVIGRGLAAARGLDAKHAIKQVDRLLSNLAIDVEALCDAWVPFAIGDRTTAWINIDWTDFDADGQTTFMASLQDERGRSTPLVWTTVWKSELEGRKFAYVESVIERLVRALPSTLERTYIVGDREFGCQPMYEMLDRFGLDYVLRFRQDIYVTTHDGESRTAAEWKLQTGKMRSLVKVGVTTDGYPVGKVVIVQDKGMQELWCLAISDPDLAPKDAKKRYGLRFECEETFRDLKDPRFGMGLRHCQISEPARRDRMLLVGTLAQAMAMLLGMAGERAGLDRTLKANTSKTRQHSLMRQGLMWFDMIPNMKEDRLLLLLAAFEEVAKEHAGFRLLVGGAK